MFQRGFQLPALPPGTETVEVNGVEYRVRTIPMDQQGGGVLLSIGIRADSILLSQARIPIYLAVGVLTVLVAGGFGWLLAGPAVRPLRRLTEQTKLLGNGAKSGAQMPRRHRCPRSRGTLRCDGGHAQQTGGRAAGAPPDLCRRHRISRPTPRMNCARR